MIDPHLVDTRWERLVGESSNTPHGPTCARSTSSRKNEKNPPTAIFYFYFFHFFVYGIPTVTLMTFDSVCRLYASTYPLFKLSVQ